MKIYNESGYDLSEVENLLEQFYPFAQKTLQFDRDPTIKLVSDPENSQNMLGKTAYYDPSIDEVVIFVDNRHPKDILRSISHELVHHRQNCQGKFAEMPRLGEGYAQKNEFLREMEKEAYLKGNMCFRDWEDGYKSSNPNILNERRIYKMSTKDWKNKELNGLLNEKWGFSMDLSKLNENQKPDYIDLDKDGDTEESMKDAAEDAEQMNEEEMPLVAADEEAEMELDTAEPLEMDAEVEIVDEPQPMDDSAMALEKIIDEMTVEQLKAALAMKQGDM